jgi:hypothetical protein
MLSIEESCRRHIQKISVRLADDKSRMQKPAAFYGTAERMVRDLKRPQAFCYRALSSTHPMRT